jgi:hypothetical protein
MLLAFSMLLLAQAPTSPPIKLASVGFTQVRVPKALATSFEETFALRLSQTGKARVTTPRDVAAVLGVERQKQLLGCGSNGSCLAELAGALGAEGIVTGEIALVGKVYQLTIKILSPEQGRVLFQLLERCKTEEAVLETLDHAAVEALETLTQTLRKPAPAVVVATSPVEVAPTLPAAVVAPTSERSKPGLERWVLVGSGGALVIGGAIAEALAISDWSHLAQDPLGPRSPPLATAAS